MSVSFLVYQICAVILATVNVVGFFLLYMKDRNTLFLWPTEMFLFSLLDIVVEFVGYVIPIFTYHRVVNVENIFGVMLLKEITSVCCFYFLRRTTAALTCSVVTRTENRVWFVLAVGILTVKCTPLSQSSVVLGLVFITYTGFYFHIFCRALWNLYHHRIRYTSRVYTFLVALLVFSLCSYIASSFMNIGIMNGLEATDCFSETLWTIYHLLGAAFLLYSLLRTHTSDTESRLLQMKQHYALTDREMDVLRLLVEGKTNREICEELHIAAGTAKTHIYNLYQKLNVNKRSQIRELLDHLSSNAAKWP